MDMTFSWAMERNLGNRRIMSWLVEALFNALVDTPVKWKVV